MSNPERRHHTRIDFVTAARLVSPEGVQSGKLQDISLKGALLALNDPWQGPRERQFILEFLLQGSTEVIRMAVTIAHVRDERHVGLHCAAIDIESAAHLRRLVELNLGSGELLERELEALSQGD